MNCERCNGIILDDEGMLVCEACGLFSYDLVNSYDNDVALFNHSSNNYIKYCRITHLKQTIYEVAGCLTKKIPTAYFDMIQQEFKPKTTIEKNIETMRTYLNKKHLNCYVKLANYILTSLKIIKPPTVNDDLMEQLIHKFIPIAEKFDGINTGRTNLLPNSFLLRKFFEEIGRYDFLPYIYISKNSKLIEKYEKLYLTLV